MEWADGKNRCIWANPKNATYVKYHDEEWGRPVYDEHKLFEFLILESFQAGLTWECVLNKREAFRDAFDDFQVDKVSSYDEKYMEELRENPGIIRNKLKIKAAVNNAKIFQKIQGEFGSFGVYIWGFTNGEILYENDVASSLLSDKISSDLKKRGMTFVGSVIIYSYLQAIGIINSHEDDCFMCKKDVNYKKKKHIKRENK